MAVPQQVRAAAPTRHKCTAAPLTVRMPRAILRAEEDIWPSLRTVEALLDLTFECCIECMRPYKPGRAPAP